AYHQFGNPRFGEVIERLANGSDARIVVLARHREQRDAIRRSLRPSNVLLPEHAVDSRSLIYHADVVIGAGGTMTREAALLGIPTYSVFAGATPAVDLALEQTTPLRQLDSVEAMP